MGRPWYAEGSWLAVKDGDVSRLMEALALESLVDLPWSRWRTARFKLKKLSPEEAAFLKVNPKEADAERRRLVFVSPPTEGWRLLVGWRFYASSCEDVEESAGTSSYFAEVADWCRRLSREFGEAHAFTADWENGTYAFILTRQGMVERQFVDASGDLLIDQGEPTAAELPLRRSFDPGPDDLPVWCCYEHPERVAAVAAGCSVHPSRLEEGTERGVLTRCHNDSDAGQSAGAEG